MDKFDERAREIRRRSFPYEERPLTMDTVIAQALRDVAREEYQRGFMDGTYSVPQG